MVIEEPIKTLEDNLKAIANNVNVRLVWLEDEVRRQGKEIKSLKQLNGEQMWREK